MKKSYRIFAYLFAVLSLLIFIMAGAGPTNTPEMQKVSNVMIGIAFLLAIASWRLFKVGKGSKTKFSTKKCPECDATLSLDAEACPKCEAKQKKGDSTCGSGVTSAKDARSYFADERRKAKSADSKEYIWRTAKDGAVCERCRSMEGKKVSWDEEPQGGHAGAVARCRCYPEAVIR